MLIVDLLVYNYTYINGDKDPTIRFQDCSYSSKTEWNIWFLS